MSKEWRVPEDSSGQSGFMEHRGNPPQRGEFTDATLADAVGVNVTEAHDMIDDVTEHRALDLGDDD